MPQLLFGGMLALILLGFYIWSIIAAVFIAASGCTQNCPQLSNNMAYLLNTIGGVNFGGGDRSFRSNSNW